MELVLRLHDQVSPGAKTAQDAVRGLREEAQGLVSALGIASKASLATGQSSKVGSGVASKATQGFTNDANKAASATTNVAKAAKAGGGGSSFFAGLGKLAALGAVVSVLKGVASFAGLSASKLTDLALGYAGVARLAGITARLSLNFRALFSGINPKPALDSIERVSKLIGPKTFLGANLAGLINATFKQISSAIQAAEPYIISFSDYLVLGFQMGRYAVASLRVALFPLTSLIEDLGKKASKALEGFDGIGAVGAAIDALSESVSVVVNGVTPLLKSIGAAYTYIFTKAAGATSVLGPLKGAFYTVSTAVADLFGKLSSLFGSVDSSKGAWTTLGNILSGVVAVGFGMIGSAAKAFGNVFSSVTTIFGGLVETVVKLLSGDFEGAWDGAKTVVFGATTGIVNLVLGMVGTIADGIDTVGKLAGIDVGAGKAVENLRVRTNASLSKMFDQNKALVEATKAGKAVGDGIEKGLIDSEGKATEAGTKLAKAVEKGFKEGAKIQSPSKLFRDDARMLGKGVELGIQDSAPNVQASADKHLVPKPGARGRGDVASTTQRVVYNFVFPNLTSTGDTREDLKAAIKMALLEHHQDAAIELGVDLSEEAPDA